MRLYVNTNPTRPSATTASPQADFFRALLRLGSLAGLLACLLLLVGTAQGAQALTISGTVTSQSTGQGVEGVAVTVAESGTGNAIAMPTETGSGGAYKVEVPPGSYDVTFAPALGVGYSAFTDRGELVAANRTVNAVLLSSSGVMFSGVVLGENGVPLPGTRLVLGNGPNLSVTTDQNGAFSIVVPPGTYELYVIGYRQPEVSHAAAPSFFEFNGAPLTLTSSLNVTLRMPFHALTVRTLRPGGGANPVSGVRFSGEVSQGELSSPATLGPGITAKYVSTNEEETTDANGFATLSLPDYELGKAVIEAVPPAEAQLARTAVSVERVTADQTREVSLATGVGFSGLLLGENSIPLGNATVRVGREETTTAANGAFSMTLQPGKYELYVAGTRQPGVPHGDVPHSFAFSGASITLASSLSQNLVLPLHALTVRTLGSGGSSTPVSGVRFDESIAQVEVGKPVALAPGISARYAFIGEEETTDANGFATLSVPDYEGSEAHIYGVPSSETQLARTLVMVEKVTEDTNRDVHLVTGFKLSGLLLAENNVPLANATVKLGPEEAITAANGSFSLTMPAGKYEFAVWGYRQPGVSPAAVPSFFEFNESEVNLISNLNENLVLPLYALTVHAVGSAGSPLPGVRFEEPVWQRSLRKPQALAPGILVSNALAEEEETTDANGVATLSLPDYEGSEARITAIPPSATQLGRALLKVENLTEDQTRVIAFGKSTVDTTPPKITCASPAGGWSSENVTIACIASDSGSGLAHPEDAAFSLSTNEPAGGETETAFTGAHRVCDMADNCAEVGPLGPVEIDRKQPTIAITEPTSNTSVEQGTVLIAQYACADGGSGVAGCEGTVVSGAALDTSILGEHTLSVMSTDAVGNWSSASLTYRVVPARDTTPPLIECIPADTTWHGENVSTHCRASDSGSGLANPADTSFSLITNVGPEEESASASTGTREVCDLAGNCAEAGPIGPIKIDRKAPTISIAAPENGAEVAQGATLKVQYTCTDGGSGVATCEGSTASGAALDTSTLGEHTLSVTSTDAVGNHSSASAKYTVVTSDTTPPTISIGSPEDGEIVNQGTKLTAGYSCSDGESGVASCEGSVPSGAPLDTSSLGEHTLSVAASDHAGNASSRTVHYTVVEPGECGESARLCQTGLGDETPPSVAGLTLSPTSIDTSTAAKSVTVAVHATDDLSGVSAVQVSLSNGSGWISAPAGLTAGGTRLNGTWEATLTVPKGSAAGSYALSVAVIDNIGNHHTYSAHELEVLGFPSALTETGSGDTTPPQLSGASASPASVSTCSTSASTTIGVQASDSSGVAYVNVNLIGPGGQSRSASASLDSGSVASGHWSAPLTLPEHAEQGSWSISIQMGDTAGNSTYISSAQLNAAGFASAVQQTCAGDTSPPQIAGVTLTPETIDTSTGSRAVVIDVHATDDLSGVGSLQATLTSGGQSQSASASLQSGGTVLDGTWQATVTLPRWSQQGTWWLSLAATDQIGNSVSLSPSQIVALGLPDSIAQTGEGDSTPPTVSSGSIAPSSFDTSQHPVSVSVHLHAADAQSGTGLVRVEFTSPNGSQHVYGEANLTSGSTQEGEWTATLEFPQFSQQGSWSPRVELWDAFGNRRAYTPAELTTVFPPVGVALPPEFGRCVKVVGEKVKAKTFFHGGFATATCLEASETHTGKYEWEAGVAKTHFTTQIKELTKVTLETVKGAKMVCAGETGTGEYAGLKTVRDVILSFTGCELVKGPVTCTSAGAAAGEVVSKPLEGILGVEELGATPAANKIGLDLYPVGKTGPLMTFACAGTSASIKGSVIVPVTENKTSTTNIWKPVATKGRQQPEDFLGAPVDVLEQSLNGATPEQIGLKLTTTQTSEEPVEVNTVF